MFEIRKLLTHMQIKSIWKLILSGGIKVLAVNQIYCYLTIFLFDY